MTIPASGPISMSMFNTELGRTGTTANSRLVSGSKPAGRAENVPGTGSLFWLGNASSSLDQSPPHAMSEWRSYSSTVSVVFFASVQSTITVGTNAIEVSYSTDGGSNWTARTISNPSVNPSFNTAYNLSLPKGTNIIVAIRNNTGASDLTFGGNTTGVSVPNSGYCGRTTQYTINIQGTTDIYTCAQVIGGGVQTC